MARLKLAFLAGPSTCSRLREVEFEGAGFTYLTFNELAKAGVLLPLLKPEEGASAEKRVLVSVECDEVCAPQLSLLWGLAARLEKQAVEIKVRLAAVVLRSLVPAAAPAVSVCG